jgi:hypothetical protein
MVYMLKHVSLVGLLVLLLSALPVSLSQAQSPNLRLSELGYPDLTLNGMYGAATVFVPFQSDWVFEDAAEITVNYVASPLLNDDRSTLTVFANDLQVASVRPVPDGSSHSFSFDVPVDRLQGDGLTLRFQGYLRLTDEACEETNNPGQWLTVKSSSSVFLRPQASTVAPTLASLPEAMIVQNAADEPPPVTVVLPEAATSTDMTVAARVLARLGADSGSMPEINVSYGMPDETARRTSNLLYAGLVDELPLADIGEMPAPLTDEGSFLTADGDVMPSDHAALQIFNSPYNEARNLLLVTSPAADGLALGGEAFQDRPTYISLNESYEFVRGLSEDTPDFAGPAWTSRRTTFRQLGDRTRRIEGTGIFSEFYTFMLPPGRSVQGGATLQLDYSFSPVLRPNESYIAAFINDVYVGTVRTGTGIEDNTARFTLPVDRLNQNSVGERFQVWNLRLEVANFLREQNCEQTHPEAAWTEIYPSSEFEMGFSILPLPDLQAYPYPFVASVGNNPSVIVIPDNPTPDELAQALRIAASLGQRSTDSFRLEIATFSEVTEASHANYNLMVIGNTDRQPLIATLQEELPAIPERQVYQALNNPENGILREAQSPWNSDRVVLLAYGQDEDTAERAINTLYQQLPLVTQPGSVAIVNEAGQVRVVYRTVSTLPQSDPSVAGEPRLPAPEPWLGVTIILVVAGLLVLGILGWTYSRANN